MSFLSAFFYDNFMKATEDACLKDWRKDLLKNVTGKVLEIGAGTGSSIDLYPDSPTLEVAFAEPDINMRAQLEEKIKLRNNDRFSVLSCSSENINSADEVFDFVFASLVLCSVHDIEASLKEIKRVLKPNGSLVFLEHVAAEHNTSRRKWQNRLNPFWQKIAGNCHLNRQTENHIKNADFIIKEIKHESMRKAMPLVRPTIRGIATKY